MKQLDDLDYSTKYHKLQTYDPYDYQKDFHSLKGDNEQVAKARCLMAANQIGKTVCGGAETAIHATGEYPDWWEGHKIESPSLIICAGKNSYKTRDLIQKELLGAESVGDKKKEGTGWIPKHLIVGTSRKPGIPDAYEKILVKHKSGNTVTILLLGYEDGPGKYMGERLHFGWCDEEPPQAIWSQFTRGTIATNGKLILTFTPEDGMTQVVYRFMHECPPTWALKTADWDDAPHITPERRAELMAELEPYEVEMRSQGKPVVGDSMVFGIPDKNIQCEPFEIPSHWPQIIGVDFGGDHPFAVVKLAFDMSGEKPKSFVVDCSQHRRLTVAQESSIIKGMGGGKIPVAWPHDGNKLDKDSGKPMAALYREEGVKMLEKCFSNPPEEFKEEGTGKQGIEVGLKAMYWDMTEGRFKVFSHLTDWFKEKGAYHRKDGKVVPLKDDLISATRYARMSALDSNGRLRFATSEAKNQKFFRDITPDYSHIR